MPPHPLAQAARIALPLLAAGCAGLWGFQPLGDGDVSDGAAPQDDAGPGDAAPEASSPVADAADAEGGAPVARRLLLVGGISDATSLSDAWTWDGLKWTQQQALLPMALDSIGLAPLGGSIVLCGGESVTPDGGFDWDGTLSWDGLNWLRYNPNPAPGPRSSAAVATLGDRVVLYGGYGQVGSSWTTLDDTWTWDGSRWTEQHPATSPGARAWAATATSGGKMVVFGGRSEQNTAPSTAETWTFDGTNWEKVATTAAPPARSDAAMATLANGEVVLFGGHTPTASGADTLLSDTWTWDGQTWSARQVSGPPARYSAAMGGLGNQVVLFGGEGTSTTSIPDLGDTWTWDGTQWTEQKVPGPGARYSAAMAADSSTGGGT